MELKLCVGYFSKDGEKGFNRTFMELKLRRDKGNSVATDVLIGPSWN